MKVRLISPFDDAEQITLAAWLHDCARSVLEEHEDAASHTR